jgi:hypothetical protein
MAMIAHKCPQYKVVVVDIAKDKIKAWNSSNLPIFEPGLDEIVKRAGAGTCSFNGNEKGIEESGNHLRFVNTHQDLWAGRRQGSGFAILGKDGKGNPCLLEGQQGRCGEINALPEDRLGHGTDSQWELKRNAL